MVKYSVFCEFFYIDEKILKTAFWSFAPSAIFGRYGPARIVLYSCECVRGWEGEQTNPFGCHTRARARSKSEDSGRANKYCRNVIVRAEHCFRRLSTNITNYAAPTWSLNIILRGRARVFGIFRISYYGIITTISSHMHDEILSSLPTHITLHSCYTHVHSYTYKHYVFTCSLRGYKVFFYRSVQIYDFALVVCVRACVRAYYVNLVRTLSIIRVLYSAHVR
jgi:hypothetical protein